MDAEERGAAEVSDRPVTFEAAMELGGFELAKQWADRLSWPYPTERTARDDLAELAYMSALAEWLRRWQPIHAHRASRGGARAEDVALAFGGSLEETSRRWHEWASAHLDFGHSDVSEDEYSQVADVFDCGQLSSPG